MGVIDLPLTTVACIMLFLGIIKYKKGLLLNKYIIALAFCFLLNFISCSYFNNQNMFTTFLASSDFYSLALFWLFYSWKWNLKKWENALWWLCLCFGICYIIQYIAYPTEIFGGQIRTESTERRMAIYGQGLASLSVIFGFNKYLLEKKIKYLLIILTGLFAVFGCGYRTMLLALIISLIVLVLRLGVSKKILLSFSVIFIILFFFISYTNFIQEQIGNMLARQETLNTYRFENDIRYLNLIYHYTSYFKNPIEMIFGSGMPYTGTSYYDSEQDLKEMYGFYYSDWGLIGLSWIIGIPAVLIMLIYSYKIFKTKTRKEYYYIGIYFFNIVISSITTHEFYIHLNFVVQAILFCIFTKILEESSSKTDFNKIEC